jgi:hypothetical protein
MGHVDAVQKIALKSVQQISAMKRSVGPGPGMLRDYLPGVVGREHGVKGNAAVTRNAELVNDVVVATERRADAIHEFVQRKSPSTFVR